MPRNSTQSFADIAVGISRMLQIILERNSNNTEYFFHSFQSPFDEACYLLESLEVAHAMPQRRDSSLRHGDGKEPSGVSPCFYSFHPDEEMRARIASRTSLEQPFADRLISVFLTLACEYAPAGVQLPAGRDPFRAPREYNLEVAAHVELGYLAQSDEYFMWNDNISSIMHEIRLWDDSKNLKLPIIPQLSSNIIHQVQDLLAQNQRIAAIKIVRDAANMSVVDAFAYVKNLQ